MLLVNFPTPDRGKPLFFPTYRNSRIGRPRVTRDALVGIRTQVWISVLPTWSKRPRKIPFALPLEEFARRTAIKLSNGYSTSYPGSLETLTREYATQIPGAA